MRRLLLLALVAASVTAGTARAEAPAVPPGAVAIVAGETVTRVRLDELLASARRTYGSRYPARGTVAQRRIQDEAVRFLVDWVEIRQQAGPLGVEADWLDALHARYAPLIAYAPGFEPAR